MIPSLLRASSRAVAVIGLALLVALVAFSLFTNLAPRANLTLFIVGGGSMDPAIPIGSLAMVSPIDAMDIAVGDVVTIRADNGVVVTHRVIQVVDQGEGRLFRTQGDANATPDPGLVPARAVVGIAARYVPLAGYAQAYLSRPTGMVGALVVLAALLLAYLSLEMIERSVGQGAWAASDDVAGSAQPGR